MPQMCFKPIQTFLESFKPCPSMTSQEARPYAQSWGKNLGVNWLHFKPVGMKRHI